MFKWKTSNSRQTSFSFCCRVATHSPSRTPSPLLEVKLQSEFQNVNQLLNQSTFPLILDCKAMESQNVQPFDVSLKTILGDSKNNYNDKLEINSIFDEETKMLPIQASKNKESLDYNEEIKKSEKTSKASNYSFETNLIPKHVKGNNCPNSECSYPSPQCSTCNCHNKTQDQISIPPNPLVCEASSPKSITSCNECDNNSSIIKPTLNNSQHTNLSSSPNISCQTNSLQNIPSCFEIKPLPIPMCGTKTPPLKPILFVLPISSSQKDIPSILSVSPPIPSCPQNSTPHLSSPCSISSCTSSYQHDSPPLSSSPCISSTTSSSQQNSPSLSSSSKFSPPVLLSLNLPPLISSPISLGPSISPPTSFRDCSCGSPPLSCQNQKDSSPCLCQRASPSLSCKKDPLLLSCKNHPLHFSCKKSSRSPILCTKELPPLSSSNDSSLLSCQKDSPSISSCQLHSLSSSSYQKYESQTFSCQSDSLPNSYKPSISPSSFFNSCISPSISSCEPWSLPFFPSKSNSSRGSSNCQVSQSFPLKHIHSPKCAKSEMQVPPCSSKNFQDSPRYQNYCILNNLVDTYRSIESKFSCNPQLSQNIPSLDEHNCCCGKCKCGEKTKKINPRICLQCGHYHSCCCGLCLCSNPKCPRSPNYRHSNSPLIFLKKQEKIYKYQHSIPIKTIKSHSSSPQTKEYKDNCSDCNTFQTKEFKDHFAICCKFQDSYLQLLQGHNCLKNQRKSKFSLSNSNIQNNVMQLFNSNRIRMNSLITTKKTSQSKVQ